MSVLSVSGGFAVVRSRRSPEGRFARGQLKWQSEDGGSNACAAGMVLTSCE